MSYLFFNPFQKIAGMKALLIGFSVIGVTAIVAFFSKCHFNGIIDAHVGKDSPMVLYFFEAAINWTITSVIFYIASLILSKTKGRFIDMGGTVALARYPYLFVSIIAFAFPSLNPDALMDFANIPKGELIELVLAGLLMLLCTIWFITLLFNAFTVSSNLKGRRAVWGFICSLILAEILSMVAFHFLYMKY